MTLIITIGRKDYEKWWKFTPDIIDYNYLVSLRIITALLVRQFPRIDSLSTLFAILDEKYTFACSEAGERWHLRTSLQHVSACIILKVEFASHKLAKFCRAETRLSRMFMSQVFGPMIDVIKLFLLRRKSRFPLN